MTATLQVTHMPPELMEEGKLTYAVDIYAFGTLPILSASVTCEVEALGLTSLCDSSSSDYARACL